MTPAAAPGPPGGETLAALLGRLLPSCTFPGPGTSVTCGVSGGADSLALLVLAVAAGLDVCAVHVDHGLRPGGGDEAEAVARVARHLGAGFRAEAVVVPPGPNLEARAREARLGALGPDALLGHTADDQAETVLLAVLRGAGLDGLAGMRPTRHPILRLRRADALSVCRAARLRPLVDPSNDDPTFSRNRVRHEVLPLLDDVARRDVAAVLARQAEVLRADVELLESMAERIDVTDVRALRAAPVALARRAVRRWLRSAGVTGGHPPGQGCVDRVLAVAAGDAVASELQGGWRIARRAGTLRLEPPAGGD